MKTILRNARFAVLTSVMLAIFCNLSVKAQTFSTRANGDWSNPATWTAGFVPPLGTLLLTATININHVVTYNSSLDIINLGTLKIENTTGTVPALILPSGVDFTNTLTGKLYITNAEFRQHRFVGGGNSGTAQSGEFKNSGAYVEIRNSIVEVAGRFLNEGGGKRIFKKGSLLLGESYEMKDGGSIDTLDKVSVSLGWSNNGDFSVNNGNIYFNQTKIQLAGTNSKFDFANGTGSGDIDYITFKNQATGATGTGDLKVGAGVSTGGQLNLDAYCVSSALKYKANSKFVGSQSYDCMLNYFPSSFVIQQGTNLNAGLSFTNPQPIGSASFAVGARYRFSNVNDSSDAILRIDSLINGATVATIDDNTPGTGYGFAFQPRVGSGSGTGKSYAVFTISFVKKGTNTPVSLQYVNATPIDIDGNAGLKEYAEVDMGSGALLSYMSSSIDISLQQAGPGIFRAQNILGIERDNLDTVSYNNMFTVANTDVSSFKIKYGAVKTTNGVSVRQYSLYMKGFSYTPLTSLPVKMTSFNASLLDNRKVELKWITATEENASDFRIERSIDGTNYSEVGLVFAYGNTTSVSNYKFIDNISNVTSKIIYYRLRSVDVDGKAVYSDIRIIRISADATNDLKIVTFPNPVSNEVRITIPANWQNKKVGYEVIASNGQPMYNLQRTYSSQTEALQIGKLAPGFYVVRVTCEGQTIQQKIIKQ